MNIITDRAAANQIINSLTSTGAKVPKPVLEEHARMSRLNAAIRNISPGAGSLAGAVAAAVENGRDPASDDDVRRVLTGQQLANAGAMQQVDDLARDRFREVCRKHADALVSAWRTPFDQAAERLASAHAQLGSVDLADTDAVVRQGGDAAAAWARATDALKSIDTVLNGWRTLATFTNLARTDPRYFALELASVDFETWEREEMQGQRMTPWQLVCKGLALSLPTFTEYRERVQVIEQGYQRQLERQAERRNKAGFDPMYLSPA